MKYTHQQFVIDLAKAKLESQVRKAYILKFNLPVSTRLFTDLVTRNIIFEFKLDKNLNNNMVLASIMAQVTYYIKAHIQLRKKSILPPYFVIAERKLAVIGKTQDFVSFTRNKEYDWTKNASRPDKKLIQNIYDSNILSTYHKYSIIDPKECNLFGGLLLLYLTQPQTLKL